MNETKAVFPSLHKKIKAALEKLELELVGRPDGEFRLLTLTWTKESAGQQGQESNIDEVTKAKETIAQAKISQREIA